MHDHGAPLQAVATMLGHVKLSTTGRRRTLPCFFRRYVMKMIPSLRQGKDPHAQSFDFSDLSPIKRDFWLLPSYLLPVAWGSLLGFSCLPHPPLELTMKD
jgi:hypothetical protein